MRTDSDVVCILVLLGRTRAAALAGGHGGGYGCGGCLLYSLLLILATSCGLLAIPSMILLATSCGTAVLAHGHRFNDSIGGHSQVLIDSIRSQSRTEGGRA